MKYSVDTSAILNAWNRYYPPDVFPTIWEGIDDLIVRGVLISTEEVLVELERKDDDVHAWAKAHGKFSIPLDEQIQIVVARILQQFPRLVDTRRNRSGADPFVIALAVVEECAVVTYEGRSNSQDRPHIPDVCDAMGIRCIDVLQLIREQKWVI